MSSDSEPSPIPSPEPKTFTSISRSPPRDHYEMDSSNGSCSSTAGRRSPLDEDSRSSDRHSVTQVSPVVAGHRKGHSFSLKDHMERDDSNCHADQRGKSESDSSSDIDIEEEDEVRVKAESVSPAKKTSAPVKPLRSFLIDDILNHKPKRSQSSTNNNSLAPATTATTTPTSGRCLTTGSSIVRPWDLPSQSRHKRSSLPYASRASPPLHSRSLSGYERAHSLYLRTRTSSSPKVSGGIRPRSADDDSQSEASSDMSEEPSTGRSTSGHNGGNNNSSGSKGDGNSPLDALFELTNKALDRVNGDKSGDAASDHMNVFNNRQPPKKKRKSRTAFTNHQIFELEKRFLYQKYLSPADRDELAGALGLTGAQVITWFQNRRAKLKRDVEELKKDMESAKMASIHKSLLLADSNALML